MKRTTENQKRAGTPLGLSYPGTPSVDSEVPRGRARLELVFQLGPSVRVSIEVAIKHEFSLRVDRAELSDRKDDRFASRSRSWVKKTDCRPA